MRIAIAPTEAEGTAIAARVLMERFEQGKALGVATGSTPLGLYEKLREAHAAGEFTLSGSSAYALDEYIGIDADHPERYRNVLATELVGEDKTGLKDEDLYTPDGLADDPAQAAADYEEAIAPGVDLQILGIGSDGHIGFNEPGGSLASRTHIGVLTEQTRTDNARFFDNDIDKVPTHCLTQGLATIMGAKKLLLLAFGEKKAEAMKQVIEGPVSAFWPGTILQHHPDVTIVLDEAAAGKLQLADYYKAIWDSWNK